MILIHQVMCPGRFWTVSVCNRDVLVDRLCVVRTLPKENVEWRNRSKCIARRDLEAEGRRELPGLEVSSTEAEYKGLNDAARECVHLHDLLNGVVEGINEGIYLSLWSTLSDEKSGLSFVILSL
jgi:hypothetical protein